MGDYRFGGNVSFFDRATGKKVSVRVFGDYRCECDESMFHAVNSGILRSIDDIGAESANAMSLIADPSAVPRTIQPALDVLLPKRGLPKVQLTVFNWSFAPDSAEALAGVPTAKWSAPASPTIAVGSAVLVQWSDGHRYPGNVRAVGDGQFEVAFADGQARWIPAAYVALA